MRGDQADQATIAAVLKQVSKPWDPIANPDPCVPVGFDFFNSAFAKSIEPNATTAPQGRPSSPSGDESGLKDDATDLWKFRDHQIRLTQNTVKVLEAYDRCARHKLEFYRGLVPTQTSGSGIGVEKGRGSGSGPVTGTATGARVGPGAEAGTGTGATTAKGTRGDGDGRGRGTGRDKDRAV